MSLLGQPKNTLGFVVAALICISIMVAATDAVAQSSLAACVNPSGIIRVLSPGNNKCNTNETLVSLSQGGQTAESGTRVVDSQGNLVGRLIDNDAALRQVNGTWVTLPVNQSGFKAQSFGSTAYSSLFFTTSDCSGQAYLPNQDLPAKPGHIDTGILYFATTPPQEIMVGSQRDSVSHTCVPGVVLPGFPPPRILASPVDQVVDLSTFGLVPPFSVQ